MGSTNLPGMTEQAILAGCLQNDATAQRELYNHYSPRMLSVCYRFAQSREDAEDMLQEGFIKVFKNLHQYKFEGELGGWIRRIMVTTAINYLKKNSRYQSELLFTDDQLHVVSNDHPEVRMDAKELAELIRQLPPGYQAIFNLHAVEGFTHVQIGELLGIKEGTSRSQYARARALLVSWLEKKNGDSKTDTYARTKF